MCPRFWDRIFQALLKDRDRVFPPFKSKSNHTYRKTPIIIKISSKTSGFYLLDFHIDGTALFLAWEVGSGNIFPAWTEFPRRPPPQELLNQRLAGAPPGGRRGPPAQSGALPGEQRRGCVPRPTMPGCHLRRMAWNVGGWLLLP